MAQLRGSRFPRRSNGFRRRVTWGEGPLGTLTGIATSTQLLFGTAQQFTLDDLTLTRMRGQVAAWLTVAGGAANEGFDCYFGMCVVSENAAAIGVTAVPSPLADIAWDGWFVHRVFQVRNMATALAEDSPMQQFRFEVDSKAMRKVHQTDVVVAAFETTESGDGSTMSVSLISRMLLKLP